ncbi:SGNH/GDSL hydrolase family protein [Micromonospora echinofusca]|uniref:GDSL-like Lipase/Acylhydrolase family protein n=1 Tax=Micromonospora echinofusca TaxID=47858 RepID=A0A1C5GB11_MICEH|nr:SGNH/GDSL hydrolase family protein [Micromonospora echinofusca]SCG17013.1 GDSL-like Lipase/Acylhydrolase family protein [Micromonospora echinofusca]
MSFIRRAASARAATTLFLVSALTVGLVAAPARAAAATYTALGDSYASGTGTREYYSDSGSCQRSRHSYPVLSAARIGATLTFPACAGATVSGVLNGQLGSLNASTNHVTVTAGGNDIGWSSVILQCALPWPATCWSHIDNAENLIRNTLPGRLDQLYSRIRGLAPNARVAVIGYPRLFNGEECNLIARISPGEQAELNAAADLLATTIRSRAVAHGFTFLDARGPFTGHAVCDDVEWLNGTSNPLGESYHPNRAGHVGYAGMVQAALGGAAARRS